MTLPPKWVRRTVLAPAVVLITVVVLATLPIWLVLASRCRRSCPGDCVCCACCGSVASRSYWKASCWGHCWDCGSSPDSASPSAPLRSNTCTTSSWAGTCVCCTAKLRGCCGYGCSRGSQPRRVPRPAAAGVLPPRGPGDSFLLINALVNWYAREPRIVLTERMQWAPALDVVLNRLPNRFIPGGGGAQLEHRISELATALDHNDAFVIFPEGGNFTERRRLAGIARLRGRGLHDMARRSETMRHVLAPHPGGVTAALAAAPDADVVWVTHSGLDHLYTVADIWRELPLRQTVQMRWWRVSATDVPRDETTQIEWLYEWWQRIDDSIDTTRRSSTPPPPSAVRRPEPTPPEVADQSTSPVAPLAEPAGH